MTRKISLLRVAGPTVAVSLILFAACSAAAVFLYRLHARTAEELAEDIDSRKNAAEIETTIRNLIALIQKNSDQVEALHENLREHIADAKGLSDSEEESSLEEALEQSFNRYQELWEERLHAGPEATDAAVKRALKVLRDEVLPRATRLRVFNQQQIDQAQEALRGTIKWVAWALVAAGTIGSLGGILLGYGVARALRHSIYRLSVCVRDAADKLRHELPTVTLSGGDPLDRLQEQMKTLVTNIEQVVGRLQDREREVLRTEQLAAVGQLAAGLAHELRNPLTAVKMLVQTSREDMEQRGLPAEDLAVIEKEIRRLEGSLQSFLDFARPAKAERRVLDLASVVGEALALVGGRARKQNVRLEFDPPPAPVLVEGSPEQLRQLLVNLALNALDAMPAGGGLTVCLGPGPDRFVELQVRDTGPGVPEAFFSRLFQPFSSSKETGLGLGLVVSRRIAEDHGGTLTLTSPPGAGACFLLRLPGADAEWRPAAGPEVRRGSHAHTAGHR